MNLSRALGTLDHQILLNKLKYYGVAIKVVLQYNLPEDSNM